MPPGGLGQDGRGARGVRPSRPFRRRDLLAHLADLVRLNGLAGDALQTQRQLLLGELEQFAPLLARRPIANSRFCGICTVAHQRTCRLTKEVVTESLAPASRKASRAISSVTPSISNRTLPGLTFATQNSTLPLPLPMRTSSGFLVIGTSGKTRIQIWPPRFT